MFEERKRFYIRRDHFLDGHLMGRSVRRYAFGTREPLTRTQVDNHHFLNVFVMFSSESIRKGYIRVSTKSSAFLAAIVMKPATYPQNGQTNCFCSEFGSTENEPRLTANPLWIAILAAAIEPLVA